MNKIDFTAFVSVTGANPNGDPLAGNLPRMDRMGHGEMSAECVKRKLRNRMMDMGHEIVVKPNDRFADKYTSIQARVAGELGKPDKDERVYRGRLCEKFMDVRAFGGTFAWKVDGKGTSIGIRGPVTIGIAKSVDPVVIEDMQITKCTNGADSDKAKGPDTMGMRYAVEFGLYRIQGSISSQLASMTGFSDADAEIIKECLRTLFVNDASSARPDGTMEVVKFFWFKHDCPVGQYSSAAVQRSVTAVLKPGVYQPTCVDDYEIVCNMLSGLKCDEIEGV